MSAVGREPVVLITGGAGFIGTNLAQRLLADGRRVLIFDNLSRPGVRNNLRTLRERYPEHVEIEIGDVRDGGAVAHAVKRAQEIYHLAAQVAVTTSLESPLEDFEINARGTLNVLEAARHCTPVPPLVFTSTNKVYGALNDIQLVKEDRRYAPASQEVHERGIAERRALDFHSPYGCSKGAADQYVLDYARSYDLPAVVFRMSCIYGPHQFGTEDQGWVAHFLIRAREGSPVTLFGDGCQVRDVLYVDDLIEAFVLAQRNMSQLAGRPFNIGGGPRHTLSLLELIGLLREHHRLRIATQFAPWRMGDQRYYVSDTEAFSRATGWRARVTPADGIDRLNNWLAQIAPARIRSREIPVAVSP